MHAIADLGFRYGAPYKGGVAGRLMARTSSQRPNGTGKTAAFLISIIDTFLREPIEESVALSSRTDPCTDQRVGCPDCRGRSKFVQVHQVISGIYVGGMDYQKQRDDL